MNTLNFKVSAMEEDKGPAELNHGAGVVAPRESVQLNYSYSNSLILTSAAIT